MRLDSEKPAFGRGGRWVEGSSSCRFSLFGRIFYLKPTFSEIRGLMVNLQGLM